MIRYIIVNFIVLLLFCTARRDNPLDPKNPSYIEPEIVLNSENSSIWPNSTLTVDSAVIVLKQSEYIQSEFRYALDSVWSEWSKNSIITLRNIDDGKHDIMIETRYERGNVTSRTTFAFVVNLLALPAVYLTPRRIVTSHELCTLTLSVKGFESPCYVAHFSFSNATVKKFISESKNALVSDTVIDIVVTDRKEAIKNDMIIGNVVFSTSKLESADTILFNCVIKDSLKNTIPLNTVRGTFFKRE